MRAKILISLILVCLTTLSIQEEIPHKQQIENYIKCAKIESVQEITGLVMDLYYSKLTIPTFFGKLFEFNSKARVEISKCITEIKSLPRLTSGTALTKLGLTLLFSSNCTKDLGPALIILDSVISNLQNVKDQWKQLLVNGVTFGLIGYQSFKDCKSSFEAIRDIWKH